MISEHIFRFLVSSFPANKNQQISILGSLFGGPKNGLFFSFLKMAHFLSDFVNFEHDVFHFRVFDFSRPKNNLHPYYDGF